MIKKCKALKIEIMDKIIVKFIKSTKPNYPIIVWKSAPKSPNPMVELATHVRSYPRD
jgi:hypothetical protein